MPEHTSLEADIALFEELLHGPDSGLAQLIAEQPDIGTVAEARALVSDILVGLRSARDEPMFTTEQMLAEMDRRARVRRDAA